MRRIVGIVLAVPLLALAVACALFSTGSPLERLYLAALPTLLAARLALGSGRLPGYLLLALAAGLGTSLAFLITAAGALNETQPYPLFERARYAYLLSGVASVPLAAVVPFRRGLARFSALVVLALLYLPIAYVALEVHRPHVRPSFPGLPGGLRDVEVEAADGATLRGWYAPGASRSSPLVILLHGVGSSRADLVHLARPHLAAGYAVALMDSRGHGLSDGMTVSFGLREKGDIARLVERFSNGAPVVLQGCSMGASVALQAAAQIPQVRAVIAEDPFFDLQELARHRLPLQSGVLGRVGSAVLQAVAPLELGGPLQDVSPAAALRQRRDQKTLVIVGGRDHVIPPSHGRRLCRTARGACQLWEVPNAEHCATWAAVGAEAFNRRISGYLRSALLSAAPAE